MTLSSLECVCAIATLLVMDSRLLGTSVETVIWNVLLYTCLGALAPCCVIAAVKHWNKQLVNTLPAAVTKATLRKALSGSSSCSDTVQQQIDAWLLEQDHATAGFAAASSSSITPAIVEPAATAECLSSQASCIIDDDEVDVARHAKVSWGLDPAPQNNPAPQLPTAETQPANAVISSRQQVAVNGIYLAANSCQGALNSSSHAPVNSSSSSSSIDNPLFVRSPSITAAVAAAAAAGCSRQNYERPVDVGSAWLHDTLACFQAAIDTRCGLGLCGVMCKV